MPHFVELSFLFFFDIGNLCQGRDVVAAGHVYCSSHDCGNSDGEEAWEGSVWGDSADDNDRGVDSSVNSTINDGFEELSYPDVLFFMLNNDLLRTCIAYVLLHCDIFK